MDRLKQQIEYLIEIDKLKTIYRRNYIADGTKKENDAEHSWYFAIAVLILSEYANNKIDVQKVINMALIHDIVEIDAGDTFIYDEKAKIDQNQKEKAAAERIFAILPDDQKQYFINLFKEFEENTTNESKFARAIDRMVAVLLNYKSQGKAWKKNHIKYSQVYEVNKKIANGSSQIWSFIEDIINKAARDGLLDK